MVLWAEKSPWSFQKGTVSKYLVITGHIQKSGFRIHFEFLCQLHASQVRAGFE